MNTELDNLYNYSQNNVYKNLSTGQQYIFKAYFLDLNFSVLHSWILINHKLPPWKADVWQARKSQDASSWPRENTHRLLVADTFIQPIWFNQMNCL